MVRVIVQGATALLVCAALWYGFSLLPFFKEKIAIEIPIDTEEKIGDALSDFYLKDETKVHTPALDSALFSITHRLLGHIENTNYNYKFTVIQKKDVNAFTLPGGRIVVFTGLIELTDSPEELAAVLAHEMGHAEKKHVTHKLVKELGLTLVMGVLTGGDAGILGELLHTITSTVFDRKQETEADEYGMHLLEQSGINPIVVATLFKKMEEQGGGFDKRLEMLSTHPHSSNRIKAAQEYRTHNGFKPLAFQNTNWQNVKASLESRESVK